MVTVAILAVVAIVAMRSLPDNKALDQTSTRHDAACKGLAKKNKQILQSCEMSPGPL